MAKTYDRAQEDVGNFAMLEHVNLWQPDQRLATLFYIVGLELTRDPFLMVGLENMWVNIGRNQVHLPSQGTQRLRGSIGLVLPDLARVEAALQGVSEALADTEFTFTAANDRIEATCPWGNRFICHAPAEEFGPADLSVAYLEFDVPKGTAAGISRFYTEIMGARAELSARNGSPSAKVWAGPHQHLHFTETDGEIPAYDGHHFQIYISDFSGPYDKLMDMDLITMESNQHEWRFKNIVDPDTGEVLYEVEHEVRSVTNPLYSRPLVNRNPVQRNTNYRRGHDGFPGTI